MFQCRGEERLAGDEQHHELRCRAERRPVRLGGQPVHVLPQVPCVRVEPAFAHASSPASAASRYAASETLESTTMFLPPASRTTMSGRCAPSSVASRPARRSRSGRSSRPVPPRGAAAVSPQRPRASGRRRAVTSAWVCVRSWSELCRAMVTCSVSAAWDRLRAASESRSWASTRASVSFSGPTRCSTAARRFSSSPAAWRWRHAGGPRRSPGTATVLASSAWADSAWNRSASWPSISAARSLAAPARSSAALACPVRWQRRSPAAARVQEADHGPEDDAEGQHRRAAMIALMLSDICSPGCDSRLPREAHAGRTGRAEPLDSPGEPVHRHRRPAQRGQVDAVQRADPGRGAGRRTTRSRPSSRTWASSACPIRGWPSSRRLYDSARIVPATVRFVDIAGPRPRRLPGAGLGNQFLAHIRETDAICQVVRVFSRPRRQPRRRRVSPERDIETVGTELILADLQTMEKAAPRLAKEAKIRQGCRTRSRAADAAAGAGGARQRDHPVRRGGSGRIDLADLRELHC